MPRKKYEPIRVEPKAKRRWEKAKPPGITYTQHLNTLLNLLMKGPKATDITLDANLEIECPVLLRVDQLCYCALKPPRVNKILTLRLCLICQSMVKFENVLNLMKEGYTETITFPICGGDETIRQGKHWIKCPKEGLATKLYPTYCKNRDCDKLQTKDITITLDGLKTKEPTNL